MDAGNLTDPARIAALIPHAGRMVLLAGVLGWDAEAIRCRAVSSWDPDHPLRRAGRLAAICGVEYGLQAAALHGALAAGGQAQVAGYVAALRDLILHVAWLDDPALGSIEVLARRLRQEAGGMIYTFHLRGAGEALLLSGRAAISLPAEGAAA